MFFYQSRASIIMRYYSSLYFKFIISEKSSCTVMHSLKDSWHVMLLYHFWKFLGLNPFRMINESVTLPSYCAPIYAIILVTIFGYVCTKVIAGRLLATIPGQTPVILAVDIEIVILKFLETSVFWISYAFANKRLIRIIDQCVVNEQVQGHNRKLIIPDDIDEYIRKTAAAVLFFNLIFMIPLAGTICQIVRATNITYYEWFAIYQSIRIVTYNMLLQFCSGVVFVRRKFYQLNENLKTLIVDDDKKRQGSDLR